MRTATTSRSTCIAGCCRSRPDEVLAGRRAKMEASERPWQPVDRDRVVSKASRRTPRWPPPPPFGAVRQMPSAVGRGRRNTVRLVLMAQRQTGQVRRRGPVGRGRQQWRVSATCGTQRRTSGAGRQVDGAQRRRTEPGYWKAVCPGLPQRAVSLVPARGVSCAMAMPRPAGHCHSVRNRPLSQPCRAGLDASPSGVAGCAVRGEVAAVGIRLSASSGIDVTLWCHPHLWCHPRCIRRGWHHVSPGNGIEAIRWCHPRSLTAVDTKLRCSGEPIPTPCGRPLGWSAGRPQRRAAGRLSPDARQARLPVLLLYSALISWGDSGTPAVISDPSPRAAPMTGECPCRLGRRGPWLRSETDTGSPACTTKRSERTHTSIGSPS